MTRFISKGQTVFRSLTRWRSELTRWQSFKQEAGGFAIATIVVVLLIVFGKMVYKLKKGG